MKHVLWIGAVGALTFLWAGSSSATGAAAGKMCGGIAAIKCKSGLYCDLGSHCGAGDQSGKCGKKPTSCPLTGMAPAYWLCGCDGKNYMDSCSSAKAGVSIRKNKPCDSKEKVVVDPASGTTTSVPEGTDFVLKLSSNPSTGYKWKIKSTDRTFGYPYKTTFENSSTPGVVGGGGYDVFAWKTKGGLSMVGTHSVKLEYLRSFDPTHPARSLTVKVKITAAN